MCKSDFKVVCFNICNSIRHKSYAIAYMIEEKFTQSTGRSQESFAKFSFKIYPISLHFLKFTCTIKTSTFDHYINFWHNSWNSLNFPNMITTIYILVHWWVFIERETLKKTVHYWQFFLLINRRDFVSSRMSISLEALTMSTILNIVWMWKNGKYWDHRSLFIY